MNAAVVIRSSTGGWMAIPVSKQAATRVARNMATGNGCLADSSIEALCDLVEREGTK